MANISASFGEGQSSSRPPLFCGDNYSFWKVRMRIFIQAQGREIWKCIVNGPYIPTKVVDGVKVKKEEEEFDCEDDRLYTLNLTAMNLLFNALNGNKFNRIMTCATAKEIWDNLEVTYEGTSQVKESKIYILTHEYEMFKMNDDESISMEIVRKILNSLPKRWESKVTAILETRDLKKFEVNELIGSLITHEYTLKRGEEEGKPKKSLTLKAVPYENESEKVAMITRRIQRKSFKKFSKKDSSKNDTLICYKCNKSGHIKIDCPLLKKDRNNGKKVMKATWDDDLSSSDSEASNGESTNLYENLELNKKKTDLENIVENFTNGKKNFEKLLGSQICVFDKAGLGYIPK
ncbi:hypothetical protein I3760_01G174400 [Carya illinoinensis]|nr:hypothetical protein I3760_01G174400 [Carya illinoinensis]